MQNLRSLIVSILLLVASLWLGACGDDAASADGDTGSTSGDDSTSGSPTTGVGSSGSSTTSGATGGDMCGNGMLDAGEDCDGVDLAGEGCVSQGFLGGRLSCAADCTYDTSACTMAVCGDGMIEGAEECDGVDLAMQDCLGLGFDAGTLACDGNCALDTSGCVMFSCGNNTIEGMEVCDGTDLGGEDCVSQGFLAGTLACDGNCMGLDVSACTGVRLCSMPALAIGPDAGTATTDTIVVPSLGQFITDVDVSLDAGHTALGDLDVRVTHVESGVTVDLLLGQCGGNDDIAALFDTDLGAPPVCASPTVGTILPEESLNAFTGVADSMGTWQLEIVDTANGDGGTLNEWCVTISTDAMDPSLCGDGVITFMEECDDGDMQAMDGCSDVCALEPGFVCTGEPSVCVDLCGNGTVDTAPGEECDDANAVDDDRCSNACVLNADVFDTEVNDDFATAQAVSDGDVIRGATDPGAGDSWDLYSFTVAANTWVVAEQYTTVDADLADYTGPGGLTEIDCELVFGGTDPDLHLFDATGDPTDDATALVSDDFDGDGTCAFIGPQTDTPAALLGPGTYYVKVDGFTSNTAVPQYAVDLQLLPALGPGDTCDPAFDLCDALQGLACDGATMTCLIPPPPALDTANWEQFSAADFDLANTTLVFTPIGGSYGVVASPAVGYPDTPGLGTIATATLPLTDDGSSEQTFSLTFPFFGVDYNSVFVNANGNLTFGAGDSDFTESVADHFDTPRISGLFDDLSPPDAGSGPVVYDEYADRVAVTWDGVSEFGGANTVELQIVLFDTGVITITYLNVGVTDGLVGVSSGSDLGNPPPETDFSVQVVAAPGFGDLLINEIMADPTPGADTNCDGAVDSSDDEFVEIVNVSGVPVDLNGVTVSDAFSVRHTFGSLVLPAGFAVAVYGGGTPQCPGVLSDVAATGLLGFNNAGDTVTLSTGGPQGSVTYGLSPSGASLTRDPDITGATFVDHTTAAGSGGAVASPGFRVTGGPF